MLTRADKFIAKHFAAVVTKERQNVIMAIMCGRPAQLLQS
jgi:hypothetical protein